MRKFIFAFRCLLIAAAICSVQTVLAQLPAFPGAEGCGKFTSGGRGTIASPTTVYEVTTLNDDNTNGTLRYALNQNVAFRTIIFRISGTIHLNSTLVIKGNTTIAGQTAPGDGICLADYPVVISGDNVIVRYLRFRMGDKNQNAGMVDGSGSDDAFSNLGNRRVVIDHCTSSWSTDEALTIYRGDSITVQWCLLSEPLNYSYHFETGDADFEQHAFGGIWGGRHASFHHNLIAHCKGRCPRFDGSRNLSPNTNGQENADFRNNVIYNWTDYSTNGGEGGNYNVVNNYYKYGPSTLTGSAVGVPKRFEIMNPYKTASLSYPKIFLAGNYVDGSPDITANNWKGIAMNDGSQSDTAQSKVATAFDLISVPTQTAAEAADLVLDHTGASLPQRDTLDERIANDVRNRTGRLIDVQGGYPHGTPYTQTVNAWPSLTSGTPPLDSDHDGMPDDWETASGSNPNNASDRNNVSANGYTNLENYLNSLASDAMMLAGSLNSFSQNLGSPSSIQNYTLRGAHLTGNIIITPPIGYEVSIDGTTWFDHSHPLTAHQNNGAVSTVVLSVRLNAVAPGTYGGVIVHRSPVGVIAELPLTGAASTATALGDVSIRNQFSIFPNPVHSRLVVKHPVNGGAISFIIYTAVGEKVRQQKAIAGSQLTFIEMGGMSAGNYVIECRNGFLKTTFSFIKLD